MRLLDLYRHADPALARVLEERMGLAEIAPRRRRQVATAAAAQVRAFFAEAAGTAASSWRGRTAARRRARP